MRKTLWWTHTLIAELLGIRFNHALVAASSTQYKSAGLDDPTTKQYLALLEEVTEHELAHLKMHMEKCGGNFSEEGPGTPDGPPWNSESGYAVQKKIRGRAKPGETRASILEVSEACADRNFAPPLGLHLAPLANFNDEETDVTVEERELAPEELQLHMTYPTDCPTDKQKLPATGNTANKRAKAVDEASGDSKPAAGDSGSSRTAPTDQSSGPPSGGQNDEQSCTDKNGKDRDERQLSNIIRDYHGRTGQFCEVKVVFCDKERNERSTFRPSENIYTLITFKNPTQDDAYVKVAKFTFQRGVGIFMAIDGCTMLNSGCSYGSRIPIIRIPPGEEYTVFRLMSAAKGQFRSKVRLRTPEQPGNYVARVKRPPSFQFPGAFPFTIATD